MCEPWVDTGGRGRGRDSKRAWRERGQRGLSAQRFVTVAMGRIALARIARRDRT